MEALVQIISTNGLAVFLVLYAVVKGPKLLKDIVDKFNSTVVNELKSVTEKLTEIKITIEAGNKK